MSNYNIEIDLMKLRGAKVLDIQGNTETRTCICIPIDSKTGTLSDSYFYRDKITGELKEQMLKGVRLSLTAFEMKDKSSGASHLIKPAFSREVTESMNEEEQRRLPWIGNIKPWTVSQPKGGSSDW